MKAFARPRAAAVVMAAACASCGGGGSSPPPPPPPPSAVVASASSSAAGVQEGQPFSVDASGSTTTNGSPLTFSWTQVSGPTVTIANPNTAKLDLNAAEVTTDGTAQFRVTVTAGSSSAQATTSINFTNIAQTPAYGNGAQTLGTVSFNSPVRRLLGETYFGLAGVANGSNDLLTFSDFSLSPSNQLQVAPSQMPSLPQSALLGLSRIYLPNYPIDRQFSVIEEAADRFRIFTRTTSGVVATAVDMTISRPCGFSHSSVMSGSGIFVGQRTGFTILYSGGTPVINRTVTTGTPLCALVAPTNSITGGFLSGVARAFNDVVALDTDTNQIGIYGPTTTSGGQYVLKHQAPAQLNASKPLTLAAWTEIGIYGSVGGPTGMAMVFTDGVHNGEHRLVIAGLDASRNLVQETYSLGLGVPVAVVLDNLDGDMLLPEVVIVKSTSPQAEIYEPLDSLGGASSGGASPLTGPRFLEIGLGASTAVGSPVLGLNGLVVAFPEKRQVKVIGALP